MKRSFEIWVLVLLYSGGAVYVTAASVLWLVGGPVLAADILYGVLGLLVGVALGVGTALLLRRQRISVRILDAAALGFAVVQTWASLEEAWPVFADNPVFALVFGLLLLFSAPAYALPSLLLRVEEVDATLQPTAAHNNGPGVVLGLTTVFGGLGVLTLVGVGWFGWIVLEMPDPMWADALFFLPVVLFQVVLAAFVLSAAVGLALRMDRGRRTLLTLCRLSLGFCVLFIGFGTVFGLVVAGPLALLLPLIFAPQIAFSAVPVRLLQSSTVQRQMTDNWQFGTAYLPT